MSLFLSIRNTDYGFQDAGSPAHAPYTCPIFCDAYHTTAACPDTQALPHSIDPNHAWSFAVTSDYTAIARNHCAATMLTNAVRLLQPAESLTQDVKALFIAIHQIVGNGPVLHLQRRANRYFDSAHLPIRCEQINRRCIESRPDRLTSLAWSDLADGHPVALLVAASLFRWHWVLALPATSLEPYRQFVSISAASHQTSGHDTVSGANGTFLIADSWHAQRIYYYTADQGSRLMAICRFHNV